MASIGIFEFGGERHEVHLSVQIGSIRIRVRNGEKSWANTFQSHYIEQLTEKTGAFKNFNLFTSILANAISNPGMNGFTLELLTPFDLEALRCKDKYPSGRQNLGDRRYLLLVQTDGFNRIHYPLSLPVEIQPEFMNTVPDFPDLVPNKAGDTKEIHTIVKQLQEEIRRLQTPAEPSFREKFEDMVRINEQLRIELEKTQAELENSKNIKLQKQMKVMLEQMERSLTKEKTQFKKILNEKRQKIRQLEHDLEKIKTDKKSLEIRVRALNTELSTYKRTVGVGGYSTRNRGRSAAQNISRSRDSSRESNRRISRHRANLTPSSSREPSRERKRPPIYSRGTASSNARIRSPSPCGSVRSVGSRGSWKSTGSNARKRFDPTAYIEAKKQKEAAIARKKHNLSNHSKHSRQNSSKTSSKMRERSKSPIYRSETRKNRSSTPMMSSDDEFAIDRDDHDRDRPHDFQDSLIGREGSFDINQIDARLSALQQYMNDLVT